MHVSAASRFLLGLLWLSWSIGSRNLAAADFVVALGGDDQNPGSVERPLATLARAQTAVRELLRTARDRDVTVLVRGGTYSLTGPLVFSPDDAAAEGRRVTYAAWPGETPVLSGGRPLSGWQSAGQDRWTLRIPAVVAGEWSFDQLFVDGQRRPRARHPNQGFLRVAAAGPDDRTSFQFHRGDLPADAPLAGADVVFLHDWSISRVPIRQVDHGAATLALAQPIGAAGTNFFRISGFEPHPRYFVEGALALVDAPGEWHLDRQQGVLTYQSAPGEDLTQASAVAPVADQLLVVRGDAEHPVRGLSFVGLSFAYASAPRFPAGYAGVQAGFHEQRAGASTAPWRGRMSGAIVFQSARGCTLENCRVEHVGGTAISLEGDTHDNRLVGNRICDVGGNGVMVGNPGAQPHDLASGNVVANNRIHECARLFYGCVGVWVGLTAGTTVAHNEIRDLPYSGISVGWVWNPTPSPCRENRIEYNHIHHVMQILSDGGGVYTLGRQPGTVIRGNLVHDVPINAGRAESNGFFIDEGSSDLLIEENVIYNVARSPIRFHRAQEDLVRRNVLVLAADVPAFRFNATDEKSINFEANQTPPAAGWSPPPPEAVGAGLEPPYAARLLGK